MSATKLASRYAKSLLDLSIEKDQLEAVMADMKQLQGVIKSNNDLRILLKSPIISPFKKLAILEKVFNGNVSEMTMAFIRIMVNKGREKYLTDIVDAFTEQYNSQMQITPVKITSATELDGALLDTLVAKIKKETGIVNLQLTTAVDAGLLGGFLIQYEDKLLDASVATELAGLKKQFSNNEFVSQVEA